MQAGIPLLIGREGDLGEVDAVARGFYYIASVFSLSTGSRTCCRLLPISMRMIFYSNSCGLCDCSECHHV